jgi:hypothetical protein
MFIRSLLVTLVLGLVLAGSAAADRFIASGQIDARPPALPVAVPAVCAVTVAESGASTAICRNTAPNPYPPTQTITLNNISCGPTLPYTGKGTMVIGKNGFVELQCHVPA